MTVPIRFRSLPAAIFVCLMLLRLHPASAADRPNILLIVSEDNGPELGCYGNPSVKTPVLDRLAAEGIRFHRAFVPQAGCSQSRAALLTGLYPHQNGQIGLATWKFRMYRADTPNLVDSLKSAGYRTGIIGKLHINPATAFPFDLKKIPTANFSRRHLNDYSRSAEAFFGSGEEPFFLSVNYPDAHRPFLRQVAGLPEQPLQGQDVQPLPYSGIDTPQIRSDTADYYNCLSRLDSLTGDLLAALTRSGKAENTLVVYLGDHGADLLRGKRTSYEGGLRIPLILRWPGQITGGQVSHKLVSTLDLAPTLLTVAAASPIPDLPGRSLIPLLQGQDIPWRQYLFTEYHCHSAHNFYPQRTVRDARYKLIQNLQPGTVNPGYRFTLERFYADLPQAIETAAPRIRTAYHRQRQPPEFELYDLQNDPHEFVDLAADPGSATVFHRLQTELTRWRISSQDPLLDNGNLKRLKAEIDACMLNGKPEKKRLTLNYPHYFFAAGPGTGR